MLSSRGKLKIISITNGRMINFLLFKKILMPVSTSSFLLKFFFRFTVNSSLKISLRLMKRFSVLETKTLVISQRSTLGKTNFTKIS